MKVKDILSQKGHNVWRIKPDDTVFHAISLMSDKNVGSLLVMNGDELRGIISERDYREKVILQGRTSKTTAVKEIMTQDVYCMTPEASVEECMALMTNKKFRHLPILEDNEVVGIVSIGDLVKSIISKQQIEIEHLTNYIVGAYPA